MSEISPVTQETLEKKLEENTKMTRAIHFALLGNPEYKQPGFIDRFEANEKLTKKHELILTKYGSVLAAVLICIEIYLGFRS